MKKLAVAGLGVLVTLLAVLHVATYAAMKNSPGGFVQYMAKLPMPLLLVVPFETYWNRARAGALEVGSAAPDFDLETEDHRGRVKLSEHRGNRPVVLVFGSYT